MLDSLIRDAAARGVNLSEAQIEQFERYLALLTEWSERANLVGDVNPDVVQTRHFAESIAVGAALRERQLLRGREDVLDVGAGAGFPGVAMKIAWPELRLTLLEATAKKTAFLSDLVARLRFDDVAVLTGRAETLAHDPSLRERFDLVLARAVAPLPALLELTLPFARIGGRVATPKGSRAAAEIAASSRALQLLGGEAHSLPLNLPGPPQTLIVVAKRRPAPPEYPRRPGTPAKSPL
ncbi:MAG: 16S rRNA (guanine(527)-N(7))-methyltransferase RsmG [Dehalococcoidia bacterium]|nr:MAG: 16S rRNA (guanine(527)-N(7))-methyltransferase RsmG [Dehalococcoidia bacterium]